MSGHYTLCHNSPAKTLHHLLQFTRQSNKQDSKETKPNKGKITSRDKHDHYLD